MTNEEIYDKAQAWAQEHAGEEFPDTDQLAFLLLMVRQDTVEEIITRLELLGNYALASQIRQEYE